MSATCEVCGRKIHKKGCHYIDNRSGESKYICCYDCLYTYLDADNVTCDYCGETIGDEPPLRQQDGSVFCSSCCLAKGNNIDVDYDECGLDDEDEEDEEEES